MSLGYISVYDYLFSNKKYMKKIKKIFIAGGSGFIGKSLINGLDKGIKIAASSRKKINLKKKKFITLSTRSFKKMEYKFFSWNYYFCITG